ncbi:MAG TPA: condensation domain-containing protein [Mycobacteriales bacterium]|nr:condensation domain-containing protein [Mycobacteriales bacterium]
MDGVAVAAEFERVLRTPVGGSDDFFSLGGTSLLAARVVAGVAARSGRLFTLVDILRLRTPDAIADHLSRAPAAPDWLPAAPGDRFELAPPQRWYAQVYAGPRARTGVMAFPVPLPGGTEPAAVRRALDGLLDRHDALRTSIRSEDGRLVQLVPPAGAPRDRSWVTVADVPGGAAEVARAAAERRAEGAAAGIPLDGGPLLRAVLVRGTEPAAARPAELAVVAHHLVLDGPSVPVVSRELLAFLAGTAGDLPPATSYRAYTSWRLGRETAAGTAAVRAWWADRLAGFDSGCHLPVRGAPGPYPGYATTRVLPEAVRAAVDRAARRHAVPVSAVRIAAWFVLCHALYATDDMVVSMPVTVREHPALRDAVGMFANHALLRHRLRPGETVSELVLDTVTGLTDSVDHREHGFDVAMALLPERCEPGRFPITGAIVNGAEADPALAAPPAEPVTAGLRRTGVSDLQLFLADAPDRVDLELQHRADILAPEEGRRVQDCYVDLLARLAGAAAGDPVADLVAAAEQGLRPVRAAREGVRAR